jgi:RNA polymerase sigma-70 factor (ECF subfamily)
VEKTEKPRKHHIARADRPCRPSGPSTTLGVISAAQATDEDDAEARYAAYRHRLLAYARKNFPDLDGDDIVQEALARAYARRSELALRDSPWPWLVTVARHIAFDELRVRARSRPDADPGDALGRHPEDLCMRMVEHREQVRLVHEALRRLRRPRRHLIEMHDLAGYGSDELAEHLGVSIGAFRNQLMRARRDLRDAVVAMGGRYAVATWVMLRVLWLRLRRAAPRPATWISGADPGLAGAAGFVASGVVVSAVGVGLLFGASPPQGAAAVGGTELQAPPSTAARKLLDPSLRADQSPHAASKPQADGVSQSLRTSPALSMRVRTSVPRLPALSPSTIRATAPVSVPLLDRQISIEKATPVGRAEVVLVSASPQPAPPQVCGALTLVFCTDGTTP